MIKSIVNKLRELADPDLYTLSEAVDVELQRREALAGDDYESARGRVIQREQSYRRRTGASAPPIRAVGLGKDRRAA